LDIDMPVIDGIRAARLIRCRLERCDTLIVALSGYGTTDCLRDTARTGFDAVIQKPTGRSELAALAAAGRLGRHARAPVRRAHSSSWSPAASAWSSIVFSICMNSFSSGL